MADKTVTLSTRIPSSLLSEVQRAKEVTGAVTNSDLLRDALISYLKELSLISERKARLKSAQEGAAE